MAELTVEQWNALTEEEQITRADEMPQKLKGAGQQSEETKLQERIKGLEEQIETLTHEKSGIYYDLKDRDAKVKELNQEIAELKSKAESGALEDYPTTTKVKEMVQSQVKELNKRLDTLRDETTKERYKRDEERMLQREDLPIPYEEAIKVFAQLTKTNPTYWRQVKDEADAPGGKPAELAYDIATRKHPDFVKRIEQMTRENLVKDISKGGIKKLPAGGAGAGKKPVEDMSIDEIMGMSDKDWEKAAKGKT